MTFVSVVNLCALVHLENLENRIIRIQLLVLIVLYKYRSAVVKPGFRKLEMAYVHLPSDTSEMMVIGRGGI